MIQSRSPPGQPRRPSTHEGMAEMKQGPQQSPQQQHGHIIQSRTTSTSHGVRSRSNGRRGRRYTQLHEDASASSSNYEQFRQQKQQRQRSSLSDQYASHDFNNSASLCQMVNEDLMDENGRCIRHSGIELCRRENDLWRVLLQDCPLCSMDVGGSGHADRAAASSGGAAANSNTKNNAGGNATSGRTKKGAESSLQTATTSPLSEEDECKSWTLSDASTSDDDGGKPTKGARGKHQSQHQQQQEHQQEQQPPPPPRKKADKYNDSSSKSSNEKKEKKKKSSKRDKTRDASRSKRSGRNNQVASLKELGRKLAMENSASATTTTAAAGAGAGAGMNNPGDEVSMGADGMNPIHVANNTTSQNAQHTQQQQQQHHPPPPPRRLTSGGSDLRSLSTKELSELRRVRKAAAAAAAAAATITSIEGTRQHTQGKVMDEASELISRMTKISSSDVNTEKRKRNSRKKSAAAVAAASNIGSPHVAVNTIRDETEAILGAAAEARARVLSRRKKLLGNSSQDLEISYNDDAVRTNTHLLGGNRRGGSEGNVTEEEMKTDEGGRGRGRVDDDILGAAAEIRLRARRSLSRSRERVKAASMFCGETPTGDEDEEENDGNETVATTQSKRSILNPHGLSVQPQAPSVERRSQSRGKERQYADDWNDDDRHNHFEGTSHSHATERRPRSRNRRDSQVSGLENNNVSSAEALINRRREMRQRIAERQSNVVKRHGRSFNELDQSEKAGVDHLADAMLHEWNSVTDDKVRRSSKEARDADKGRRGRSRSVVRDGLSKIRSASLNAFRKSITSSHGAREGDNCTVDSGRRSTQSSTSILSRLKKKKQVRSLSRSRSVASEFDARSDCKSDSFALQPGGAFASSEDEVKSSAGSVLRRFSLSKSKNDQIRSLSRGSFRDDGARSGSYASNGADAWMTEENDRSSLMSRLSKTMQSKGTVRSLSRNGSIDGEMGNNDIHETTKSESFAMNHSTAWAFEDSDEMHRSNRFSKRSPRRRNPFD